MLHTECTCIAHTYLMSERAKGAEKALYGETVVQKRVFEESVSSLPLKASDVLRANLKGAEKKWTLQKHPVDNRFSARRLLCSFVAL